VTDIAKRFARPAEDRFAFGTVMPGGTG